MGIIPPVGETFTFKNVKSSYIPEDPKETRYEYAEVKLRRESATSVTLFTPITSMYRQDEKDPEGFMKGYLRNY